MGRGIFSVDSQKIISARPPEMVLTDLRSLPVFCSLVRDSSLKNASTEPERPYLSDSSR